MLNVETKSELRVTGRYYWELLFNLDNSKNKASITLKESYEYIKKINYKNFLKNTNNIKAEYTYENKIAASLEFLRAKASSEISHSFHIEMSNELIVGFEKCEEITEKKKVDKEFIIGPRSTLKVYRLVYEAAGQIFKSDIISSEPEPEVIIDLDFLYKTYLPGFDKLVNVLVNTRPGKDNIKEWEKIRDNIIEYSDVKSNNIRFHELLKVLSITTPSRDNRLEWSSIRETCNQILSSWDTSDDKIPFLKKLTARLATITPGSSNKIEWAKIREVSNIINSNIKHL